jgi:hypothetical protein
LKRIRKDIQKSLSADATVFFHQQGVINNWEYDFQESTMHKRNLSPRQMAIRQEINAKVLASVRRRGLS